MARLHEGKLAAVVYVALVINKRRNEKIKYWIMLREEMGKENIGLRLKLNILCIQHLKEYGSDSLQVHIHDTCNLQSTN
jgi:hypothetical protein